MKIINVNQLVYLDDSELNEADFMNQGWRDDELFNRWLASVNSSELFDRSIVVAKSERGNYTCENEILIRL